MTRVCLPGITFILNLFSKAKSAEKKSVYMDLYHQCNEEMFLIIHFHSCKMHIQNISNTLTDNLFPCVFF